ncbi:MAG: hypothetical protein ACW981_14550 [Candidatus Hodarchaeales archaeon]|jgi:hypothetical protein
MFKGPEKTILEAKNLYLIHNIIEKEKIGEMLAERELGKKPKFVSVEKIDKNFRLSGTGIVLFHIQFNSEMGQFNGFMAYKEFNTSEEVNYNVLLNNWLKERLKDNKKVKIPEIYAKGENYILYEGILGETFDKSPSTILRKAKIAGEILASFHSSETYPADIRRYLTMFTENIDKLPIKKIEKDKLLSMAYTFLVNYDHSQGGVYGYGFFQPDNVMITLDETQAYLIDPEFLESKIGAERIEDVANFFQFLGNLEFQLSGKIEETKRSISVFLQSYNTYLKQFYLSLEKIYSAYEIWGILLFHLGLASLKNGVLKLKRVSSLAKRKEQTVIEELSQLHKFIDYVWKEGMTFVPDQAFPIGHRGERINKDGWTVSWVAIGKIIYEKLKEDEFFQLIYNRPKNKEEASIKDLVKYWNLKNKKELEEKIKELNEWFNEPIIHLNKDELSYNEEIVERLEVTNVFDDWEKITKKLKSVYLRKPENKIINEVMLNKVIDIEKLELLPGIEKKTIQNITKTLIKEKILLKTKQMIKIHPDLGKENVEIEIIHQI